MKKSILFVNGHLQVGGVEKALVELLSCIDYDRFDVDLLLLEGEGDYRNLVPDQVRVLQKDMRQFDGPFWKALCKNLIRGRFGNVFYRIINVAAKKDARWLRLTKPLLPVRNHYDVAVAFRPGHPAEIVAFSLKAELKICWWHHGAVPDSDLQRKELASLLCRFDKVATVSEGCKRLLSDKLGINPGDVAVIPNIIDATRINVFARGEDPFGEDKRFRIVTLSRFSPEKHLEEAVEAASLLLCQLDFVWYFIGDGPEFGMLKERVERYGLTDRVVFTGSLANPYPYLKHSDLMVHPSHVESLCIAVLEAMALEVPCVVVRSIGPDSFIENGHNGILVEKGPEAILQGIHNLIGLNSIQLRSLTTNASRTVESLFSPQVIFKSFERLIDGK